MFVRTPDVGVPSSGVTRVGDVANTAGPDPVSSDTAAARLADVGVPRNVATPVPKPDTPVEIGNPVSFVSTPDVGVPSNGVTITQDVTRQKFPLPLVLPVASAEVIALIVSVMTFAAFA